MQRSFEIYHLERDKETQIFKLIFAFARSKNHQNFIKIKSVYAYINFDISSKQVLKKLSLKKISLVKNPFFQKHASGNALAFSCLLTNWFHLFNLISTCTGLHFVFCKLVSKMPLDPANNEQLNHIFPDTPPPSLNPVRAQ